MAQQAVRTSRPKSPGSEAKSTARPRTASRRPKTAFGQPLQAKLTVGAPNDRFEREADRAAGQVLGASSAAPSLTSLQPFGGALAQRACSACSEKDKRLQRKCACGGMGGDGCTCNADHDHEPTMDQPGGFPVSRRAAGSDRPKSDGLEQVSKTIARPGKPLPSGLRQDMETRFDRSFRDVRMHDDRTAAASAAAVHAHAYTVGHHVVFGQGQFRPGAREGRRLIAHELAHTVQQGAAAPRLPDRISRPSDRHERQADRAADSAMGQGTGTSALSPAPAQVSRYNSDDFFRDLDNAGNRVERGLERAADAADRAFDAAGDAVDAAGDALDDAVDSAVDALSGALSIAEDIARAIGGTVSVSGGKVVISVASFSPCPQLDLEASLADIGIPAAFDLPLLLGVLPISGPVFLYGSLGLGMDLDASLGLRLDGCNIGPFSITIDPLSLSANASGSVSVGAAFSHEAKLDISSFAQAGVMLVIPDPPAIIQIPVVTVRLGGSGHVRLTGGGTVENNFTLGLGTGGVSATRNLLGDIGLQTDVGLGLFASLEVLGNNLCRFNFPLYEQHTDDKISFDLGLAMNLSSGGFSAGVSLVSAMPAHDPLASIGANFDRSVLEDDCVLCDILSKIGAFPSQRHGPWPYHPTPPLGGPERVFQRDPGLASGGLCRGACGIDCPDGTCTPAKDKIVCVPPDTEGAPHTLYVYEKYQECGSHQGCRDHDACYDWAAAGAGEVGTFWMLFGPQHRLCDLECFCDYGLGSCVPWAAGGGDQPQTMAFADKVEPRLGCLGPCPGIEEADGGQTIQPIHLQGFDFFDRRTFEPEPFTRRFGPVDVWGPYPLPITGTPVDMVGLTALVRAQGGARAAISGYIGPLSLSGSSLMLDPAGLVYGGNARLALGLGAQGSVSLSGALNGALTLACAVELGSLTGELMVTGFLRLPSEIGAEATIRCHDGLLYLDAGVDFSTVVSASVMLSAEVSGRALGFDVFRFPWHSDAFELYQRRFELGIDFAPVYLGRPAEFVVDQRLMRLVGMLTSLFGLSGAEEPDLEPNDEPGFLADFSVIDPCGWFGGGGGDDDDDDDDDTPQRTCIETKATADAGDADKAIQAGHIPGVNDVDYGGGQPTFTVAGGSSQVGNFMEVEYLTNAITGGSKPSVQNAIYREGGIPMIGCVGKNGNQKRSKEMYYVRGHLLNHNIGGPGDDTRNLFPITDGANGRHRSTVEKDLKSDVSAGKVMYYRVRVQHDTPAAIVSEGVTQDFYEVSSTFNCDVAEYRVCEGDWLERKSFKSISPIVSTFVDRTGASAFQNVKKSCPHKSD